MARRVPAPSDYTDYTTTSVTPYRGKCGRDLITRVEIRGHKILGDIHGQIHGNTIFVDCDFEKYSCDTDCSGHYIIPLSEVESLLEPHHLRHCWGFPPSKRTMVDLNTGSEEPVQRVENWISGLPTGPLAKLDLPPSTPSSAQVLNSITDIKDFEPQHTIAIGTEQHITAKTNQAEKLTNTAAMDSYFTNPQGQEPSHDDDPRPRGTRPIRGNFIPVSKSSSRLRSPSPKRESNSPTNVLQLTGLTDAQMERFASMLSEEDAAQRGSQDRKGARNPEYGKHSSQENRVPRSRSRSPVKSSPSVRTPVRARTRSPVKRPSAGKSQDNDRKPQDVFFSGTPQSKTRYREQYHGKENVPAPVASPPSVSRRRSRVPVPINTDIARNYSKLEAREVQRQYPIILEGSPKPAIASMHPLYVTADDPNVSDEDDASSIYSREGRDDETHDAYLRERYTSQISPLHVKKESYKKQLSILQEYENWRNAANALDLDSDNPSPAKKSVQISETNGLPTASTMGAESPFSTLPPQYANRDMIPGATRSYSKTMIGKDGWLDDPAAPQSRSSKPAEKNTSPSKRAGGIIGSFMKKAKEMIDKTNEPKPKRESHESTKSEKPSPRTLATSLNPREQSLLYCELEFQLTSALNDYIDGEFRASRLDTSKLKRVSESWQQKGRTKVQGFRYDLETQLDLVRLHANDFMFHGPSAAKLTSIFGIIDMVKVDARAMRIRTYCHPDTVIAKQLLDAQHLFNLLGCDDEKQVCLAGITHFFKAAVERDYTDAKRRQAERESAGTAATTATTRASKSTAHSGNSKTAGKQSSPRRPQHSKTFSGENDRHQQHHGIPHSSSHGVIGLRMDPTDYSTFHENDEQREPKWQ